MHYRLRPKEIRGYILVLYKSGKINFQTADSGIDAPGKLRSRKSRPLLKRLPNLQFCHAIGISE